MTTDNTRVKRRISYPPVQQRKMVYFLKMTEELFKELEEHPEDARVKFTSKTEGVISVGNSHPFSRVKESRRIDFFFEQGSDIAVVGTVNESLTLAQKLGTDAFNRIAALNGQVLKQESARKSVLLNPKDAQQKQIGSKLKPLASTSTSTANTSSGLRPSNTSSLASTFIASALRATSEQPRTIPKPLPSMLASTPIPDAPISVQSPVVTPTKSTTTTKSVKLIKSRGTSSRASTSRPSLAALTAARESAESKTSLKRTGDNDVVSPPPAKKTKSKKASITISLPDKSVSKSDQPSVASQNTADKSLSNGKVVDGSSVPQLGEKITSRAVYNQQCELYKTKYAEYEALRKTINDNREKFLKLEQQLASTADPAAASKLKKQIEEEFNRAGGDTPRQRYHELHKLLATLRTSIDHYYQQNKH